MNSATPEVMDELDALRLENRQLRRALAEMQFKHEALLFDQEQKTLSAKYGLREGDGLDMATRAIRRASSLAKVA